MGYVSDHCARTQESVALPFVFPWHNTHTHTEESGRVLGHMSEHFEWTIFFFSSWRTHIHRWHAECTGVRGWRFAWMQEHVAVNFLVSCFSFSFFHYTHYTYRLQAERSGLREWLFACTHTIVALFWFHFPFFEKKKRKKRKKEN